MRLRRFLVTLACASAVAVGAGAVASGGNDPGLHNGTFTADLTCPGQTYYNALFKGWIIEVSPTTNYVVVTQMDLFGLVLHNTHADPRGQPLVTCTYIGPISGKTWINTGFFTPAG